MWIGKSIILILKIISCCKIDGVVAESIIKAFYEIVPNLWFKNNSLNISALQFLQTIVQQISSELIHSNVNIT